MKKIKNWNNFLNETNSINESFAIVSIIGIIISLINILKMIGQYNLDSILMEKNREYELEKQIEEICGYKITIYSFTRRSTKSPVTGAVNKIYFDKKLKDILTNDELISVLLHEASHVVSKDILKSNLIKLFPVLVYSMLNSWLLFLLAPLVSKAVFLAPYHKKMEYSADSFAKKYGYGNELINSFEKMSENYIELGGMFDKDEINNILTKLRKSFQTHPDIYKRISKLYDEKKPQDFKDKIVKIEDDHKNKNRNRDDIMKDLNNLYKYS